MTTDAGNAGYVLPYMVNLINGSTFVRLVPHNTHTHIHTHTHAHTHITRHAPNALENSKETLHDILRRPHTSAN